MIWLSYILKMMLIQLIAFIAYRLLLDREPLGHWKRAYLLGSLFLSLVIPLVTVPALFTRSMKALASAYETSLPTDDFSSTPELLSSVEIYSLSDLLWPLVIGFYVVGTLVYLLRMLKALWSVSTRLSMAVSTQKLASGVRLVGLAEPVATHTFLDYVFFHEAAPPVKEVLAHELAHARQWHSLDRLFIGTLRVVFWFNPLLWYYERAIRINHELLADQAVLRQGIDRASYQQQLLNALRRPASPALGSGVDFHLTKKRFQMMYLSEARGPRVLAKLLTVGFLWVALLFSFGQASYAQTAPPPPPPPPPPSTHGHKIKQAIPTAKQLAAWQDSEDYRVYVDHKLATASTLKGYKSSDFSQYYVLKYPENSGKSGLHIYMFTEKSYPWPNVPPPPPPLPPMPPSPVSKVMAPPAPPAPPVAPPAPPAPPTPPGAAPAPPSAPAPPPPPPMPTKGHPTSDQLEAWQDARTYGVWLDGKRIKNVDLKALSPTDIHYYSTSTLQRNAVNYGKYKKQLALYTKAYAEKIFHKMKNK
jgi:beta-lactamase regulating signal transducer with metallopeptidase domain